MVKWPNKKTWLGHIKHLGECRAPRLFCVFLMEGRAWGLGNPRAILPRWDSCKNPESEIHSWGLDFLGNILDAMDMFLIEYANLKICTLNQFPQGKLPSKLPHPVQDSAGRSPYLSWLLPQVLKSWGLPLSHGSYGKWQYSYNTLCGLKGFWGIYVRQREKNHFYFYVMQIQGKLKIKILDIRFS